MRTNASGVFVVLVGGCLPGQFTGPCAEAIGVDPIVEMPVLDVPCDVDIADPSRLLVTTTDFATGAVSVVDLASGVVDTDVAAATTDSVPSEMANTTGSHSNSRRKSPPSGHTG